ncbi:MAG: hypothetical protein GY893_07420, partial [bacterium]|nr:hypothetical protein [bacterium]
KTWVAAMGRGSTNNTITATFNFGQDSSFAGAKTAQGNGGVGEDFFYTPPAGFKALNTNNLDDPAIEDPTDHFNTVLYTGNNTNAHAITGVGFQPDFTWLKHRDNGTAYSHQLYDVNRGATNYLTSNTTAAENDGGSSFTNGLQSFNSDGFTIGQTLTINASGVKHVAWNWKAGGSPSSNSDGSITTSVSANTTAGFSIVTYSGSSADPKNMGHGLSQAPELIITKQRTNSFAWKVGSDEMTNWQYIMELDGGGAESHAAGVYNGQAPTSSVWYASTEGGTGAPSCTYVAYCFHSVEGYSKIGQYTGNGNADGTFIYTGFRPAYVMTKDISGTGNWTIIDNKRNTSNVASPGRLYADLTNTESPGATFDLVSNGFKCRENGGPNVSGVRFLYLAFAESPFKTANAR